MPPIWTNTFKLLSHIQPSYENKMSDLVRSDIKHSLLCWVSITKSVWCENIVSFTQATPSKSIWLNKDYILLRATCDEVPLLTMSRPYSPDIFRKQLPSAVVRQSKLFHWTLSCWNGVILPWETGQPSLSQPCRFFQSKAESCSRRRQKGWMGGFFSTNLSQNDQKEQRGVIVFGYLGFHSTVFKVVQ